jgi:uncharacterized membrane protein
LEGEIARGDKDERRCDARHPMATDRSNAVLWAFVAISALVNLTSALLPGVVPLNVEAALLTALPIVFAFAHGSRDYNFFDVLVFAIICLIIGNAAENLSILTGVPFGHYHFTESLGPKLFLVPLLIGPAYFGMGYLSWMLARIILGDHQRPRSRLFAVPVLASFLMVAWDLSIDPLASTVRRAWIWTEGGSYFGVPVSNFLGWYLTVYVFSQLFALYLHGRAKTDASREWLGASYWLQAIAFYGVTAIRIILIGAQSLGTDEQVTDGAGVLWRVHDIYAASALVCAFTMVAFTILALLRLADQTDKS